MQDAWVSAMIGIQDTPTSWREHGWTAALLLGLGVVVQVLVACLVLLRPQRRQSSSLAWIVLILLVPVAGVAAFVLFGEVRIGRRRVQQHAEIQSRVRAAMAHTWRGQRPADVPVHHKPLAVLARLVGQTEPRDGNHVELYSDTLEVIDHLIADIDRAREHVHLLFYIYLVDDTGQRVAQALMQAAARGVVCRLLVDALGSRALLESALRHDLEEAGVRVVGAIPAPFVPFLFARMDLRNHRKIAVIDQRVGYTGSQNIADPSFAPRARVAPWVDCMLRLEGPAVVDLQELFVEDWFMDTEEDLTELLDAVAPLPDGVPVQVMGTGPNAENLALVQLLQAAVHVAREEVILTTPYFVPDEGTLAALCTAAGRGVEVTLVLPRRNDSLLVGAASRAFYEVLLGAGVRIHEYTRGLLHAKTITVDRGLALMSTANFDRRSFEINFEVSTLIYDSDVASRLRFIQKGYLESAPQVHERTWNTRPIWRRIAHNAAGLMGPLL
jgi:cardiolipin synthase